MCEGYNPFTTQFPIEHLLSFIVYKNRSPLLDHFDRSTIETLAQYFYQLKKNKTDLSILKMYNTIKYKF